MQLPGKIKLKLEKISISRKYTKVVSEIPEDINSAHAHCTHNNQEIKYSKVCGCFFCLEIYPSTEVISWIDNNLTALCPRCSIDSVIGDASGYEISKILLSEMKKHWF
jgi:hypothetical protein